MDAHLRADWIVARSVLRRSYPIPSQRSTRTLSHKLRQRACQVILVITVLFYVSIEVAGNLTCRPFESIWNKRIRGTCFDRTKMDIAVGALNIVSHMAILLLPQGIIWKLQLPFQKKMGIAIVFMFGVVYVTSEPNSAGAIQRRC